MMIGVAVVALVVAGEATRRRWVSLALTYRKKVQVCEHAAYIATHSSAVEADHGNYPEKRRLKRIADHYLGLATKYERAARFPWVPIGPDPPEPR
jgi:hypothetical protein